MSTVLTTATSFPLNTWQPSICTDPSCTEPQHQNVDLEGEDGKGKIHRNLLYLRISLSENIFTISAICRTSTRLQMQFYKLPDKTPAIQAALASTLVAPLINLVDEYAKPRFELFRDALWQGFYNPDLKVPTKSGQAIIEELE